MRRHVCVCVCVCCLQNILKRNWLDKHHNRVPSVIIPVVDVDSASTSLQWADVEAHINDVVVKLRPSMVGRSNELHVLMVQQRDYTRANEDKDTQELMAARIQSYAVPQHSVAQVFVTPWGTPAFGVVWCHDHRLRRRVGLNSNQVSIINTADITDVSPAFIRLDAFFRERAAQYYRFHARRVKKFARQVIHRQKALHVRLCFKTAQFYEFCSLPDKSLVQLLSAFKALCALNMGPSNYDEVKGVAEMISFKVLHQYIRSGAARQAVAHFKTHMRWFRNAYGPTDLVRAGCTSPVALLHGRALTVASLSAATAVPPLGMGVSTVHHHGPAAAPLPAASDTRDRPLPDRHVLLPCRLPGRGEATARCHLPWHSRCSPCCVYVVCCLLVVPGVESRPPAVPGQPSVVLT